MTTIPLAASVTLPVGDITKGTDYYIGVNAQGVPSIGSGAFGVAVPANLHTWEIDFDTAHADPAATCFVQPLWSVDQTQPRLSLVGNGGVGFPGGTWTHFTDNTKTTIVTDGKRRMGPDAVQQDPYPTLFILHVTQCTAPMLLDSVSLVLT